MYYYLLRTTEIWLFLHICLFNFGLLTLLCKLFCGFVLLNVGVVPILLCILIIVGIPLTFRRVYLSAFINLQ